MCAHIHAMAMRANKTRRGLLELFVIGGGAALAVATLGCSAGDSTNDPYADGNTLPPRPSGPVPPNTIPVSCPW